MIEVIDLICEFIVKGLKFVLYILGLEKESLLIEKANMIKNAEN